MQFADPWTIEGFLTVNSQLFVGIYYPPSYCPPSLMRINNWLVIGNVAVTAGLLALSLWIRFFGTNSDSSNVVDYFAVLFPYVSLPTYITTQIAGVHARFDANTKKALKRLDGFILISTSIFGLLLTWQFINIFSPPSYGLLSMLSIIYTVIAALFVLVVTISLLALLVLCHILAHVSMTCDMK
jgi:hypothetical protein